jgi:hypothetical protein
VNASPANLNSAWPVPLSRSEPLAQRQREQLPVYHQIEPQIDPLMQKWQANAHTVTAYHHVPFNAAGVKYSVRQTLLRYLGIEYISFHSLPKRALFNLTYNGHGLYNSVHVYSVFPVALPEIVCISSHWVFIRTLIGWLCRYDTRLIH